MSSSSWFCFGLVLKSFALSKIEALPGTFDYMVDCSACQSNPITNIQSYTCAVRCNAEGKCSVCIHWSSFTTSWMIWRLFGATCSIYGQFPNRAQIWSHWTYLDYSAGTRKPFLQWPSLVIHLVVWSLLHLIIPKTGELNIGFVCIINYKNGWCG